MIEIGILYADDQQVWKPIAEKGDFRLDGVLCLTLTTERGNPSAICARMFSFQNNDLVAKSNLAWWGEDSYAIGVMPDNSFFTYQWAENDELLYARSIDTGEQTTRIERPVFWPSGADVTVFTGEYLEPPEWEKALEVFKTELF